MRTITCSPMVSPFRQSSVGLPFLVLAGSLWGAGDVTGALLGLITGLSPIAVSAFRLTIGGLLLTGWLAGSRQRWPRGRTAAARIIAIGLLSALYQGSYFTAARLTSVSLAAVVTLGAAPVLVLIAERTTRRRQVDRWMVGTLCLAVGGLVSLVGLPSGHYGVAATLAGAGLALLAAAGFATITLLGARPVDGLSEVAATGLGFLFGGAVLWPITLATTGLALHLSVAALGLLVAFGLGPTALAYLSYFRGLRTVDPTTATLVALLEPLTAAVLATVILGERLGVSGVIGAGLLALAVIVAARARRGGRRE